jgi:isoamylase
VDSVDVLRSDGHEFADDDWDDPQARSVKFIFGHEGADAFALLLNAAENVVEFAILEAPHQQWQLAISNDPEQQVRNLVTTLIIRDASFTLLQSAQRSARRCTGPDVSLV